ncbi:hypothetical protein [uncultured Roseovarius sp.]|uniref:hypothetical protein n=1 Tax=uncultured Roseovarius sp. TaxID=293344 RepID=UPI0026278F79|nr:hypothetical protein [uncultured Roseovarius sp.]
MSPVMSVVSSLFSRLLLVFALSVALAAVGFAHRVDTTREANPDFRAFVAAGGSVADICDSHAPDGPPHHQGMTGCDACRLIAGVLMPAHAIVLATWQLPRRVALWSAPHIDVPRVIAHALQHSRAPPRA